MKKTDPEHKQRPINTWLFHGVFETRTELVALPFRTSGLRSDCAARYVHARVYQLVTRRITVRAFNLYSKDLLRVRARVALFKRLSVFFLSFLFFFSDEFRSPSQYARLGKIFQMKKFSVVQHRATLFYKQIRWNKIIRSTSFSFFFSLQLIFCRIYQEC